MNIPTYNQKNSKKVNLIKLSADVHKKDFKVCRQIDGQNIESPQVFKPEAAFQWALKQRKSADRVVFCHEAGFSGFSLARRLEAQGIEPLIMCPQILDERCKRIRTDRRDTRAIAGRLDRYLAGNKEALVPVRIPTVTEEDQRAESRQEGQMMKARKQFEAQGRSYLHFKGLPCPSGWWRGDEAMWAAVIKLYQWPEEVVRRLEVYRRMALAADEESKILSKSIESQAQAHAPESMPALPAGFGAYTMECLRREVCDYGRFKNRRHVGAFCGLVCAESSSGDSQSQGSITKTGSPRARYLLIELSWRALTFQPNYRVVIKFAPRIAKTKPRSVARKKLILAVARHIAIDLWRLYTNQTTMEKLGLTTKNRENNILKKPFTKGHVETPK